MKLNLLNKTRLETKIKGKKILVGEVIDDQVFIKKVKKSKHLFRKLDAWGTDYYTLVNSVLPVAKFIVVYDKEENVYYGALPSYYGTFQGTEFKISTKARIMHFKGIVEDHDAQIFLPRRYWLKDEDLVTVLKKLENAANPAPLEHKPTMTQLSII